MVEIHVISSGEQGAQGPQGPSGLPGTVGSAYVSMVNAGTISIPSGSPVYHVGTNGVRLANANNIVTKDCFGFSRGDPMVADASDFIQVDGLIELTTTQWDVITGTVGGLVVGKRYFLSAIQPGKLVYVLDETSGFYAAYVGYAINATVFKIEIELPILL